MTAAASRPRSPRRKRWPPGKTPARLPVVGLASHGGLARGRRAIRCGALRRIRPVMQAGQDVLQPGHEPDDRLPDPTFPAGGPGPLMRPALVAPPGPGRTGPGQPDRPDDEQREQEQPEQTRPYLPLE